MTGNVYHRTNDEDELEALREHVEATSPVVDSLTNEVPVETSLVVEYPFFSPSPDASAEVGVLVGRQQIGLLPGGEYHAV